MRNINLQITKNFFFQKKIRTFKIAYTESTITIYWELINNNNRFINITVTGILEKSWVGKSCKQGIQATWFTPILYVKWWISRFRGAYRNHMTSLVELFMILVNSFRPLYSLTGNSVLVVMSALDLSLHFIIFFIIIITIIINIIFITFIINMIFEQEQFKFTVWLCFIWFLCVLTWSTRALFGVDALRLYYHLASFNYDDMKARDIDPTFWWLLWAILCLIVSSLIIER